MKNSYVERKMTEFLCRRPISPKGVSGFCNKDAELLCQDRLVQTAKFREERDCLPGEKVADESVDAARRAESIGTTFIRKKVFLADKKVWAVENIARCDSIATPPP